MDRRTYLISVFEDTLARIKGSAELTFAEKQSITAQKLILENEPLDVPAPAYSEQAHVVVTRIVHLRRQHNTKIGMCACSISLRLLIPEEA